MTDRQRAPQRDVPAPCKEASAARASAARASAARASAARASAARASVASDTISGVHPSTRPDDPLAGMLARAVQRRASVGEAVLQRFQVVQPRDASYPEKWHYSSWWRDTKAVDDERFFSHQQRQRGRFFNDRKEPFLVTARNATLNVSDDGLLAIDANGEAKTFFAIHELIAHANDALRGEVRLELTDRYLWNKARGTRLFEVEPVVATKNERGLAMKTPQRCNQMAEFASGTPRLRIPDTLRAVRLLAAAVQAALGGSWVDALERCLAEVKEDPYGFNRFQDALASTALASSDSVESELAKLGANLALDPSPGVAIAIFSVPTTDSVQAALDKNVEPFSYHFATVVTSSSTDYVTLENYARRDPVVGDETLSGGDPLYFFRMYSLQNERQSWHRVQSAADEVVGMPVSLQYR